MAKTGFQLDNSGLEKQINQLKIKIAQGIIDGFESSTAQDYMKEIMKFYIQDSVYNIYTPKVYERTYALRDNVAAKVIGDTLFVYINDAGMDKPNGQWSYPWRVILGNDVYPYDYQNGGAYEEPRDFRRVTREEFVAHMNQSQKFLQIVKNAIQRRIR